MAYPVAAGTPSMSGIYIPEIWSMQIIVKLYEGTCLSDISNTKYQGEIKAKGDKVIIRSIGDVTIRDHVDGQDLVYEDIEGSTVELLIDKGLYFGFNANLVTQYQSDIDYVSEWSTNASNRLKIKMERNIFADIYASAHANNKGATAGKMTVGINLGVTGTPLVLTKDNINELIVDVGTVLDEQDVPDDGDRFIILPARMMGLLKKSDLREYNVSGDSANQNLRKGKVGMLNNFNIISSNLLARVTDGEYSPYHIIAGHKMALTFASQIVKNEKMTNPKAFGEIVRGLQVYGYKVIKPEALVDVYAR